MAQNRKKIALLEAEIAEYRTVLRTKSFGDGTREALSREVNIRQTKIAAYKIENERLGNCQRNKTLWNVSEAPLTSINK